MLRFLTIGAVLAFLTAPAISRAAAPTKADGPALTLTVQSVDQLLHNAEYIAFLVGQEETAKQLLGFVKALAGDKGIEGVDTKKPFVVYGNLAEEIINSEAVVMVPIADKDAFLGLLKGRLGLKLDEEKDGSFSTEAPNNAGTIYFRFANGYVYATMLNKANVAATKILKPEAVVGTTENVLSVAFRVDRMPAEMKKFALGAIETKLGEAKDQPLPKETKHIKALKDQLIDSVAGNVKAILADGEEVTFKIDIDSKKDELAIEFAFTAKKGSDLAKDIADLKSQKSIAFGSLATRNAALLIAMNASVPNSVKKLLGPAVEDAVQMGLEQVPADAQEIIDPLVKALIPTLKSGEVDGGIALLGPDADNKFTAILAGKIASGKEVETSVKNVVAKLPDPYKAAFEIDADSAGAYKLHTVKIKDRLDEKAKKLFGESDLWIAFRDDAALVAIGPKAKDALKDALKASPAAGSIVRAEFSVARLVALAEVQDAKAAQKAAKAAFGSNPTGDSVTLSVDGGDSLRTRLVLKGQVIKFAAAMDKAKKNKNN